LSPQAERRTLKRKLLEALSDIRTIQAIERYHDEMNIAEHGKSNKVHVRKLVKDQESLSLSGNNRPADVARKIENLERDFD